MTLTERWQNVYKGYEIGIMQETKRQVDDPYFITIDSPLNDPPRTHYLKTYWNEDGVICSDPASELIEIKK